MFKVFCIENGVQKIHATYTNLEMAKHACDAIAKSTGLVFYVEEFRTVWTSQTLSELISYDKG